MLFLHCIYTRFLSVVRVLYICMVLVLYCIVYIEGILVLFVYCIYTRFLNIVRVSFIYKVSKCCSCIVYI